MLTDSVSSKRLTHIFEAPFEFQYLCLAMASYRMSLNSVPLFLKNSFAVFEVAATFAANKTSARLHLGLSSRAK